jgi:hypothetical protein
MLQMFHHEGKHEQWKPENIDTTVREVKEAKNAATKGSNAILYS